MQADVIKQVRVFDDDEEDFIDEPGEYVFQQDPDSGEIIRKWAPPSDDPGTPEVDESKSKTFRCIARGIVDGGVRVAGTTQRFGDGTDNLFYENVDYVKITFPANVIITKADKVTNIRNKHGIIWKEEEIPGSPATVFNVMGMTPVPDPFGNVVEYTGLLARAEDQT